MTINATTSQPVTPVEELREAARLMRERAEAAAPSPWTASPVWSPNSYATSAVYSQAHPAGSVASEVVASGRVRSGYGGIRNPRNAVHIAGWHPTVALVVADMLDSVAERHVWASGPTGGDDYYTACTACGYEPADPDEDSCPDVAAALAVARAYLGGTR